MHSFVGVLQIEWNGHNVQDVFINLQSILQDIAWHQLEHGLLFSISMLSEYW